MGGKSGGQVRGFRYLFGIHMGVCRDRVDELVEIQVGDRSAWNGSVTDNAQIQIDAPDLFGGDDGEGGIVGPLDVLMGEPSQGVLPALQAMLGGLVPAFRRRMTLFFDGQISSNNPYPKPWKLRVRRALTGWQDGAWYPAKAQLVYNDTPLGSYPVEPVVGGYPNTLDGKVAFAVAHAAWAQEVAALDRERIKAMNPAHILYQCWTSRAWGRGLASVRLDDAVWRSSADTFYNEGFGLCLRWTRQDTVSSFMQAVLDHAGAVQFADRLTGLIKLRPIRGDYDVEELPLFTHGTGLLSIEEDDSGTQSSAFNEVVVKHIRPQDGKEGTARVRNLASIRSLGGAKLSTTRQYPGLPTHDLALRVAARDLRAASGFVKRFKVRLDRRGAGVQPASTFRVSDPLRGIVNLVLRAGAIENGSDGQGTLLITALQDVFGLPATAYGDVQVSRSTPADFTAVPIATSNLIEAPYRELARTVDAANLAVIPDTAGYMAVVAKRPTPLSMGYRILARIGVSGAFVDHARGGFTPTGTLVGALSRTGLSFTIASPDALSSAKVGQMALIDEELVRIDSIVGAVIGIARGCADAVPVLHAAGARVWFLEAGAGSDPTEYSTGNTVQARLLTQTSQATLDESLAIADDVVMAQRQARPYPPGNLKVNGVAYPASISGDMALTWSHRDRLTQADQLIDTTVGNVGPEAGVTYTLRIYNGVTLKRTVAAIAGTSYTYLNVDEVADGGPFDPVRFTLHAVRGGLESRQGHDYTVDRV